MADHYVSLETATFARIDGHGFQSAEAGMQPVDSLLTRGQPVHDLPRSLDARTRSRTHPDRGAPLHDSYHSLDCQITSGQHNRWALTLQPGHQAVKTGTRQVDVAAEGTGELDVAGRARHGLVTAKAVREKDRERAMEPRREPAIELHLGGQGLHRDREDYRILDRCHGCRRRPRIDKRHLANDVTCTTGIERLRTEARGGDVEGALQDNEQAAGRDTLLDQDCSGRDRPLLATREKPVNVILGQFAQDVRNTGHATLY